MKITITRHGETVEGLRGEALGGRRHGHLAPSGKEQARVLAKNLRSEKYDMIFSSYLKRAKDTALEVAKYHPKTPIKFLKVLRERDPGESPEAICKRIKDFLEKYVSSRFTSILIVSHTGTSRALTLMIQGQTAVEWESIDQMKNTAVSIFEVEPGKKGKCVIWNKLI